MNLVGAIDVLVLTFMRMAAPGDRQEDANAIHFNFRTTNPR
jgi:hypothetical protein